MTITPDVILKLVDETDQKHEDGHKRLRRDVERLESRLDDISDAIKLIHEKYLVLEHKMDTPLDVTKLMLKPGIVASIVGTALVVSGSMWALNSGMRSDVRDILTRMESQRTAMESAVKYQELQTGSIKTAVDEMRRRQELQQLQIAELKESIITLTNQRRTP